MFLTVYYMAATILQCFRLRSVLAKMAKMLNERGSVVFYNLHEDTSDMPVSSELCVNQRESRIVDSLWHSGTQRGCSVQPRQIISINPWITFPQLPLNIPIKTNEVAHEQTPEKKIYMLVEAKFQLESDKPGPETGTGSSPPTERFMGFPNYTDNIFIEEFGYPLAWKVDTHFAFLLQTDEERLTKFIIATFMSDNFSINNDLQLFRIETVDVEGEAQPFELIRQHAKKDLFEIGPRILDNPKLRQKYISLLTDLCFLARQADEFNAEKARQEKPDLIASSCVPNAETLANQQSPTKEPEREVVKKVDIVEKKKPLKRTKRSQGSFMGIGKPPNILVYSESLAIRDNALAALTCVLKPDTYTVYPLSTADVKKRIWQENTQLLVVCGPISHGVGPLLLDFYLNQSGKMLCLCSDLLNLVLPNYRTAEVREQELAQFNYHRWQKVPMMHHIFCYQPSPIKKHFSHDGEETQAAQSSKMVCPKSVEITDSTGSKHLVDVQILGVEETWQTPSILLAIDRQNNGRAIFSQVHLEADPSQFEGDVQKFEILRKSNVQRLEILSDLLSTHLNVEVQQDVSKSAPKYTFGYLLGGDSLKSQFLMSIQSKLDATGYLSSGAMNLFFVSDDQVTPEPTERFLPIQNNNANPESFNYQRYCEALSTREIGRLVIYIPIVTSSMDVVDKLNLCNGLIVIPKYQSNGSGRSKNKWLSAEGCLMFTVQLKIRLNSVLGQRIPLVQHVVAVAITNSIVGLEGYQDLDLRIKWPNDIYANGAKVGGLIVATSIEGAEAICNVGVGLNLDNGTPTICVNDLIRDLNSTAELDLATLSAEVLFARIFNEMERLLDEIEKAKDLDNFYDLYYQLWLHQDQQVQVQDEQGVVRSGTVAGIDEYGYLKVDLEGGRKELSVHPDGNSFDMLRGLILPKFN